MVVPRSNENLPGTYYEHVAMINTHAHTKRTVLDLCGTIFVESLYGVRATGDGVGIVNVPV